MADTDTVYTDSYAYTYDRFERQLTATATFNGSRTVTMAADTYNSIGQLCQSKFDGLAATYSYNVRGALRSISASGYFSQTLYYEDGPVPCRNGNISRITDTAFDHRYTYDGADRLTACTVTPMPAAMEVPRNLSTAYKYDRNSNITALTRYGETTASGATGLVDDLTMTYEGNQLMSVSDAAAEVLLERSLDFQDGADSDAEYAYNAPDIARFLSPDPLADIDHGISPYVYCRANPIMYIDPDGKRPTNSQAAYMAQYSYLDDNKEDALDKLSKNEWKLSDFGNELNLIDEKTGLNSCVMERTVNGKIEYAYIFAGTQDTTDRLCDIGLAVDIIPQQTVQAVENAKELSRQAKDLKRELTFVGHSLGGQQAAAASMATGNAAITFNPASVTDKMRKTLNLGSAYKVTNFVIQGKNYNFMGISLYGGGDPLFKLQSAIGRELPGLLIFTEQTVFNKSAHSIENFTKNGNINNYQ